MSFPSFPYEIETDSASSEMDTRATSDEDLDPDYVENFLMGLSRASLKKYSSPARKRILARQRNAEAARNNMHLMGFSLKPPKSITNAVKKATKSVKKLDTKKLNTLVKTYGPLVAVVYPPAAPAVAAATVALNAIEKGDPKATAELAATQAAAASGNPEAQQALEMYNTAKALKANVKANGLLKAAQSGDPQAVAQVAVIKAAATTDPQAAAALKTLEAASQGKKNIAELKARKEAGLPIGEKQAFAASYGQASSATATQKTSQANALATATRDMHCQCQEMEN